MKEWLQGYYTLINPEKYLGDPNNVQYRSSWELHAFERLDKNPAIIKWASEEIGIPYPKPDIKTGQYIQGLYIPDLYIVKRNTKGKIIKELIEVKPAKQLKPSKARKPQVRMQEEYQYLVNKHKWAAAEEWCKKRNIVFRIMTEKNMFI
jgi:hypothetical protein